LSPKKEELMPETTTPVEEIVDETAEPIADETLVEEVSIDGMCGVY
jgi:mycofactocin precursor